MYIAGKMYRAGTRSICIAGSGWLRVKKEWKASRGRRKCIREVQETEWQEEEGGQGHSCDKEVRMKDVASVRP